MPTNCWRLESGSARPGKKEPGQLWKMNAAQIVVGDRKVPGDGHRQRWTTRETPLPSETHLVVADISGLDYYWEKQENQSDHYVHAWHCDGRAWIRPAARPAGLPVPLTLHASLMARLERFP
jgi:hypothetical protein